MAWMRIRLELARSPDFPEGSARHGYEFVLPLDETGRLDRADYKMAPELCTVHRFWDGSADLIGTLRHTSRGQWNFSYHRGEMENEPIPHFAEHRFREGEYLTLREPDGAEHTFRIAMVAPAPGLAQPTGSHS